MPADRLAVLEERCDRLAKCPGECAVRAGLAFVDLRAFGMQLEDGGFAGSRDGVGKGGLGGRADGRPDEKNSSEYGVLE